MAYNAFIDGIFYNLSTNGTDEAEVTSVSQGSYSGEVVIPGSFVYGGKTYSVTSIGAQAFFECSLMTSITLPSSLTTIGKEAFYGCRGLTTISIPQSVTSIGEGIFWYCDSLTAIRVEDGNSNYDSHGDCNAIIEKATNTLIAGCMNTVIPNDVTGIGLLCRYIA